MLQAIKQSMRPSINTRGQLGIKPAPLPQPDSPASSVSPDNGKFKDKIANYYEIKEQASLFEHSPAKSTKHRLPHKASTQPSSPSRLHAEQEKIRSQLRSELSNSSSKKRKLNKPTEY